MRKSCLCSLLLILLSCVVNYPQLSGTISDTDSGCMIEGLVRYADGKNAEDAAVVLHDLKKINMVTLAKQSLLIRSGKTKTNVNGFFQIDSVDTGQYLIEINDHDTFGAVIPATIKEDDTLIQINSLLGRCGSLKGKIDTSRLAVKTDITVYVPELGRNAKIDSSGTFTISNLPAWSYQLRIALRDSLLELSSDSIRVSVAVGDTTYVPCFGSKTGSFIISGEIIEQPNE